MSTKSLQKTSLDYDKDRLAAESGIRIVLKWDESGISILDYEDNHWYAMHRQSVQSANTGTDEIQDADFYFGGIGFIEDAIFGQACFDRDDADDTWMEFYEEQVAV